MGRHDINAEPLQYILCRNCMLVTTGRERILYWNDTIVIPPPASNSNNKGNSNSSSSQQPAKQPTTRPSNPMTAARTLQKTGSTKTSGAEHTAYFKRSNSNENIIERRANKQYTNSNKIYSFICIWNCICSCYNDCYICQGAVKGRLSAVVYAARGLVAPWNEKHQQSAIKSP